MSERSGFALRLTIVVAALAALVGVAAPAASAACENEALRSELGSSLLPDCRAYEQVSPQFQAGYPLNALSVAADGEKAILTAIGGELSGGTGGGEHAGGSTVYATKRTPAGWQLAPLNPPGSQFVGQLLVASEPDNGLTLWEQHTPQQSQFRRDLYVRSADGSHYSFIGPAHLPLTPQQEEEESNAIDLTGREWDTPVAATRDFGHVILRAIDSEDFWKEFDKTGGQQSLYEYSGTGNSHPILVGVDGPKGSTNLVTRCGVDQGGGRFGGSDINTLSADGETVFFSAYPCEGGFTRTRVYARIHGSTSSVAPAETEELSESECTVACGEEESGKQFEGAGESGAIAYLTSTQKLTDDAVSATASGNAATEAGCHGIPLATGGCNLYEFDFGRPKGHRLGLVASAVQGVVGVAADGSRVYFVSGWAIPGSGPNEYERQPLEAQPNLYVYDAASGRTSYIATLGAENEDPKDWSRVFRERPVEVGGQSGQFLMFASATPQLTPDDHTAMTQLFEYDAETGELVRISKGEDRFNDDGNGVASGVLLGPIESVAEGSGGGTSAGDDFKTTSQRLNISADGHTVAFLTAGQLSPRALSAAQGCRSLYEFHSDGPIAQGSVHLVSDGRDTQLFKGNFCGAVQFQGMSDGARDILFTTADSLLASDADGGQQTLYDARVGGGFATPLAPPGCDTGPCFASPSIAAPPIPAPASAELTSEGNLTPPAPASRASAPAHKPKKCARGRTRRHGKCVKTAHGRPHVNKAPATGGAR